uniref:Molybdenum cofactor sulfurase middle domain-containing protein n=1 Tax=Clastoptera arizonana TaxID=38151 RepID=A0A1B6DQW4_9HEMI
MLIIYNSLVYFILKMIGFSILFELVFLKICKIISTSIIIVMPVFFLAIWKIRRKNKHTFQLPIPINWCEVGKISNICIYPLKSGKSKNLNLAYCSEFGIREEVQGEKLSLIDSSFVLYDEITNKKLNCQDNSQISSVEVKAINKHTVSFICPGYDSLMIEIPSTRNKKQVKNFTVKWFGENIQVLDCGEEASNWFTKTIVRKGNNRCRLGYFVRDINTTSKNRGSFKCIFNMNNEKYEDRTTCYRDISTFVIMTEISLKEVNKSADKQLNINNPNIIIEGVDKAFEEETWDWLKIGDKVVSRSFKEWKRLSTDADKMVENGKPQGVPMALYRMGSIKVGDAVYISCSR